MGRHVPPAPGGALPLRAPRAARRMDPEAEWERALAAWEELEREVEAQAAAAKAAAAPAKQQGAAGEAAAAAPAPTGPELFAKVQELLKAHGTKREVRRQLVAELGTKFVKDN